MNGILYFKDGTLINGKGFGAKGTAIGELVFNTAMTGYQEVLTDPSYGGQIITMTYPLIGNYGINSAESESSKIHARGFVVKNACEYPSNYMSEITIDEMLKKMGIVGVSDVDTRRITKIIRSKGALKCVISNEDLSKTELDKYFDSVEEKGDWMKYAGVKEIVHIKGDGLKVALLDFGAKGNIVQSLKDRGCDITIFPYHTTYEEIINHKPDGVMLSNGPGDPKEAVEAIELVGKIIKSIPTFGICLGHQLLALAVGGDTYKMKYGHRGGNHGVYDLEQDRAYITSQNHGYTVDPQSIENKDMIITHVNLNDKTVEGMKHKELPVFSVQFHPEGAPGPTDSTYIFEKFISMMKGEVLCR